MTDESHCDYGGTHKLCCPPNSVPKCGWHKHNNGKCSTSDRPSDTLEIGSNDKYCRSGYQLAYCSDSQDSMKLYDNCAWSTDFPDCSEGLWGRTCGPGPYDNLMALSSWGSGGAQCDSGARRYCCEENSDQDAAWADCQWSYNVHNFIQNVKDGTCYSDCPTGKIRIAMDTAAQSGDSDMDFECSTGARARCCTPEFKNLKPRNYDDEFGAYLETFLNDPVCPSGKSFPKSGQVP